MKDPRIEQWLTREGVEWHWEAALPLSWVDWDKSLRNQARVGQKIVPEHVDELADKILDGISLPDTVGYFAGDKLIIISGNHRISAYLKLLALRLGPGGPPIEKVDWYIVTTNPQNIDILTRISNAVEGLPLTREDRLVHAKHLVIKYGFTQEEAAKALGIGKSTVGEALQTEEVQERLAAVGFKKSLPLGVCSALFRIKENAALSAVASLASDALLSRDEAAVVATKVAKAAAGAERQKEVVDKYRQEFKDRIARLRKGQTRSQLAPIIKFRRAINTLNGVRVESIPSPLDSDTSRRAKWALKKLQEITTHA